MKIPTTHSIKRAYSAAIKRLQEDEELVTAESSAGFVIPDGQQKKKGFQVFVTVYRFDEELLERCPETGGLLIHL